MKEMKSQFSIFSDAVLLAARDKVEEEIKVRTRQAEIDYNERMKLAKDSIERGKITHLMQVFRARIAVFIIGLKLLDEMVTRREEKKIAEVSYCLLTLFR